MDGVHVAVEYVLECKSCIVSGCDCAACSFNSSNCFGRSARAYYVYRRFKMFFSLVECEFSPFY
jgi:hypothetical protein